MPSKTLPFLGVLCGVICFVQPTNAAPGDVVLGRWNTEKHGGIVEIYRCGARICGRVVDGAPLRANPDQRDERNSDKLLRTRRIMHLRVLENFVPDGDKLTGGPLYDPDTGVTGKKGTLTLSGPNILKVKGCIALFLCKTQTWVRAR